MRDLYMTGQYSQRQLAARFEVGQATVWRVLNGCSWSHVAIGAIQLTPEQCHALAAANKPRGERCPYSKVSDADVEEMRRLYCSKEAGLTLLAKRFGLSKSQTYRIVKRKSRL